MAVTVYIPTPFRRATQNRERIEVASRSVAGALDELERTFTGFRGLVRNESGQVHDHVNIYVNNEVIDALNGLATPLQDGDEVAIIPALAGGCGIDARAMAADMAVRVSEIFVSVQGEGPSVGTPSVFVRLQGCTVGCVWCDTKYSWDPRRGREIAFDTLLGEVRAAGTENVVLTGGEPLEHPAFTVLVTALKGRGHRVEVETAGVEVPPDVDVDQWNVSLKLAHSGVPEARRLRPMAITRFRDLGAWFKFVVGDARDVDEVLDLQARYGLPSARIVLMPLGMRREEQQARMPMVVEWCRHHGFRFSPRLHILIWGPKRGV